jgi:hypothetical protein
MRNRMKNGFSAWVVCAVLVGCAEQESEPGPNPCNARICDVLDEECQEDIMLALQCFRGEGDDVMPEVRVISEDEYIDIVRGEQPTEDMQVGYERFSRAMALLKLAPEKADEDATIEEYASEIAAAYVTDEKSVLLIDRGEPLDSELAVATFAHEMVHALQDQERGLEGFYNSGRPTLDATLAARALIEGEATHYELLVFAALGGVHPARIDFFGYYASYQFEMLLGSYRDESPLALSFIRFPYAFGGDYVSNSWVTGGQRGIERLFADPPEATSDVILFAERPKEVREDVAAFREQSKLLELPGWQLVAYDELGSFVIDNFLHRMKVSDDMALDVRSLRVWSDGLTVLFNEESAKVAVAWRMHFQPDSVLDTSAIKALRTALAAPNEDAPEPGDDVRARVYTDERDLYIFASDGPLPAAWLGEDVAWEAAPFDREDDGDGDEDAGVDDEDGGVEDELPSANRWRSMPSR